MEAWGRDLRCHDRYTMDAHCTRTYFIIAEEALRYQIADRFWQIHGLPLPDDAGMLIDKKYVDDTMVYVMVDATSLEGM